MAYWTYENIWTKALNKALWSIGMFVGEVIFLCTTTHLEIPSSSNFLSVLGCRVWILFFSQWVALVWSLNEWLVFSLPLSFRCHGSLAKWSCRTTSSVLPFLIFPLGGAQGLILALYLVVAPGVLREPCIAKDGSWVASKQSPLNHLPRPIFSLSINWFWWRCQEYNIQLETS